MIAPPWDEHRLRREFDALLSLDSDRYCPFPDDTTALSGIERIGLTPRSEDALAAELVDQFGTTWRQVGGWGAWLHWTGTRWMRDETGRIRELARLVCRKAAADAEKPNEARRIASDKTITAVLRIAATDPRVAMRTTDWDVYPMLLNTPAGVVDLSTGEVRPHDPTLHITQVTHAKPGKGCPRWMAFLEQITAGDPAFQAYLKRLAGYCLTGSTKEQMFAFFHGSGANGKSVFINTLAAMLGDYAVTATLETFMASNGSRHLSELAGLRAARLVTVSETEKGRSWAESRIKAVTGGEKLRANFMRQDFFEFTPQFKLLVAGNHRPDLSGPGEAMERRLQLIPFTVTIPTEQRDPDLAARFIEEADGILGWMLEGCTEWMRIGLAPPAIVTSASRTYCEEQDLVGQWIEECCVLNREARTTSRTLYGSWRNWSDAAGVHPGSQKSLGEALRHREFVDGKVGGARGWIGIGLRFRRPTEGQDQ